MNYEELCARITDENAAMGFLQEKGILHAERKCELGHQMKLSGTVRHRGPRWRCCSRTCKSELPVRKGTWLEGSKQSLKKIVQLIYAWCHGWSNTAFCKHQLKYSNDSLVLWNRCLREVTATALIRSPAVIGGPGKTVEVDESVFSKSKYNRGRRVGSTLQWVLGGVCRETRECFLVPIPNRSSETLVPAIKQFVRPGTTVMSDHWRGYLPLRREDYEHLRVNHSLNFVDPRSGAHTQRNESLWAKAKRSNKVRCGTHRHMMESYLCEFMWRQRLKTSDDVFEKILQDIVAFWPPE